ncbi:MAG: hypothetical protein KGL57_03600 [Burkholderiales bacterium]|nr:hypothetical protein [Burkholderiales bacterium]
MSHAPRHPAMPSSVLRWAGLASIVVHVGVLSIWLGHHTRHDVPANFGQRAGAIQARLATRLPQRDAHSTAAATPQAAPRLRVEAPPRQVLTPARPAPVPLIQNQPLAAHEAASAASAPSLPAPLPTPVPVAQSTPGASFANLFAPIISRPMGRGRWGAPPPLMPQAVDPEIQRQQAVLARRAQLMQTIQWLQTQLADKPLEGSCEIRITLSQSAGTLTCSEGTVPDLFQSALANYLTPAAAPSVPSEACWKAHDRLLEAVSCPP